MRNKDQHLCKQVLSEGKTDLLRNCGCGWDTWEGDCPNTNGLWTREEEEEEEEGGWAACSNMEEEEEEEGTAERKGPDWTEFSTALNRSPVNMETEEGEKLQLTLWFEGAGGKWRRCGSFSGGCTNQSADDHKWMNFSLTWSISEIWPVFFSLWIYKLSDHQR